MHYPSYGQELQFRYVYSGNFIEYEGFSAPSANESDLQWVVKKYTNNGSNITKISFADGECSFNKSWANRANYSYR